MLKRIAIVAGLVLFSGAIGFTFIPTALTTSSSHVACGWWFAPAWDKSEAKDLAYKYADLAEEAFELGEFGYRTGMDAIATGKKIAMNWRLCDDKLSMRRNVSLFLLLGAIAVPAIIFYVARGRDETDVA